MKLPREKKKKNIYYLSKLSSELHQQEQTYINVRQKERRLYDDEIVRNLPDISGSHPFYHEWQIRKESMNQLVKYFSRKKGLNILDVGAGNCWLSNQLSLQTENFLFALDINILELEQGARVFEKNENLKFIFGNIFENIFEAHWFDALILSSSIQYFNDLNELLQRLFLLLTDDGEIHITDSPFYNEVEISKAIERSHLYYNQLGVPEMSDHYNHHNWKELERFNITLMDKAGTAVKNFLSAARMKKKSPFPWIKIKY